MGKAFDTFNQYADKALPGQVHDLSLADIVSRAANGGDIGYGLAVADLDIYNAKQVDDEYDVPTGITVRESVRDNGTDDVPVYPEYHEMSVMRVGRIWVTVADGCVAEEQAYVDPDTGGLVSSSAGNILFTNAKFKTTATAGNVALVQLGGNG
jgi:hypothetical protein